MNAKQATFKLLDAMAPGARFTGYGLMLKVQGLTGDLHYPATVLRYMRTWRSRADYKVVNVSKRKSIYEVKK